jgi:hypothetical protein
MLCSVGYHVGAPQVAHGKRSFQPTGHSTLRRLLVVLSLAVPPAAFAGLRLFSAPPCRQLRR